MFWLMYEEGFCSAVGTLLYLFGMLQKHIRHVKLSNGRIGIWQDVVEPTYRQGDQMNLIIMLFKHSKNGTVRYLPTSAK